MLLRSNAQGAVRSAEALLREHGHTGVNRGAGPVAPAVPPRPVSLTDAAPGLEQRLGDRPYWHIRLPLREFAPNCRQVAAEFGRVMRGARQCFDELEASVALCHLANAQPEDVLFMDIESCGLAGTAIFLVGVMLFEDDDLIVEQYLARDYSEEPAVLDRYHRRLEQSGLLVTFNGKSFDTTAIAERSAFHGLEPPWQEPPHLDLLHESRRRWRKQLPNCKLQTLEHYLCGRRRVGDIPGAAIPDAYHGFVASGDARQLRDILHHNRLDLLTMAQLIVLLLTGCDPTHE